MAEFDDNPDERLQHEAEELMRQKRFLDAARRYQDLRTTQPTDLWASLGHCSALECAGRIQEAEQVLEEITLRHKRSAPLHRFRRLFFERREDLPRAQLSTAALESEILDDGPDDQLADLYFNQGRYIEARDELGRLLRRDGDESDELRASLLARIGACLRQIGELDDARRRLREALDIEADHHWTLSELAEVERAQGDHEAARTHYLAALRIAPEDHWCRGHLAQLEAEMGNRQRSEELYREILSVEPGTTWALVELAQLVAERDADESRSLCERALSEDPHYPWAHAHIGQLARRAGDLRKAIEHYQDALDGAPDAPWLLHELAECHRLQGRFEEAHKLLDRAREHDPYEASTYGYLADLLRAENRIPETLAHLEKAVELDPEYTWAWRELAELRALREEHDAADTAYKHAVEIDGDEAVNDGLRAFLLRCRNRRDAAQPWLERAVEKQADYLWAWRELIDLHLSRGNAEDAEKAAALALSHVPESPPLLGLHAESLRRLGRHSDALTTIDKALVLADEVPQLHALKAEILAETGRTDQAEPCAARACELDASPEYRALHAQILLADDRVTEANALVRELLAHERPIQPAYELAAVLAERADDNEMALQWCERGLVIHENDARLITRRAKLGVVLHQSEPVADLIALIESGASVPWRDAAQILAQANEPALARRAVHHVQVASEDDNDERRARAWLLSAEVELALGRPDEANAAAERAIALDDDCVPARVLAAVLADRRGKLDVAIAHLEHIDQRLHAVDVEDAGDSGLLLRQLAGLYERAGTIDTARLTWERIRSNAGDDDAESAVEEAAFLLRVNTSDAETIAAARQPTLPAPHLQRLLRERALAAARQRGTAAGYTVLNTAAETEHIDLDPESLLLQGQLALASGDPRAALAACDHIGDSAEDPRIVRLLRVRILLALRRLDEALALAKACAQNAKSEEATTLLAEALALRGDLAGALREAQAPSGTATGERGLLIALLHLATAGEVPFIAALGRMPSPATNHPLARVFATAWPGAWGPESLTESLERNDVLTMPPIPEAARLTAIALAQRGRHALAAHLALAVASTVSDNQPEAARTLRLAAVPWLRQAGEHRAAISLAWTNGAPLRYFGR